MKVEYSLNNDTLEQVVSAQNKLASVFDHVADALKSKFSEHPDVLANLFYQKPVSASRGQPSMAEKIGTWAEIYLSDQPIGGIRHFTLTSGPNGAECTYDVRFVGEPISFYKYFVAGKSAICADPYSCPVKKKFNIDPVMRHAVHLIDRADDQMYLAELPPTVFDPVAIWARRHKTNPGGAVAVGFSITVKRVNKCTRYVVVPLERSELTDEEQKMPRSDLRKLFKPTPEAHIEEKLFGKRRKPEARVE